MIKDFCSSYPHIEMLSHVTGQPINSSLGIRQCKESIMDKVGMSKGANVAKREVFTVDNNPVEAERLVRYVNGEVDSGKSIALLIIRQKWDNAGGSPVVYLASQDDLNNKLIVDDGQLTGLRTQSGEVVKPTEESHINTYSRQKSIAATVSGLDNYSGEMNVSLGGGFRLQVDNITQKEGKTVVTVSGVFSFNDRGSRVLSLESTEDQLVPRYSGSYSLVYEDGVLILESDKNLTQDQAVNSNSATIVCQAVVERLLKRDGQAITSLLRSLFSVSPSLQIHQLEGIYSYFGDDISAEVIDFDGIDSIDATRSSSGEDLLPELNPQERLLRGQLMLTDFLVSDPSSLRDLSLLRKKAEEIKTKIVEHKIVPPQVVEPIVKDLESMEDVGRLTGSIKLGRLLKTLNLKWESTDIPEVNRLKRGRNTFISVSVEGYELAYWVSDGELLDTGEIDKVIHKLTNLFRVEITRAQLNSIREGD